MKLTQKLLSLLHRVFDPDPEKFLALRMSYGGTMTWTVAEGVLTTSVVGGIGQGFSIDLTTVTITQLVAYIAARPGYQVLYVDGSSNQSLSARVLMDGTGNIAQSNGDHLYGYTSLVWAYFEAVGTELKAAKAQIPEAIKQMSVPTASSDWIDELGAYYGVPRLQGETDQSYGARIIAETVRPRANNVAMERAISYYTGQATKVTDVTIYGAGFPKYNGAITRNSAYQYQPLSTPKYGLFDVEIGYDLLGGTDQSAFADVVAGIVEKLRSAGTHMRALSMQAGAISDTFTPPTDNSPMTIVATPVLTETLTAPTEGTFTFTGALTTMSDSFTPGTESAFDAIHYGYCYNGIRTRNGAIKYGGDTLETFPAQAKEWAFMTGIAPADLNVARASIGTRYNQQGLLEVIANDLPRMDYDPYTRLPLGLLIEESRTNLLTYSNDFSNAVWGKANVTVTDNSNISPDGTLSASTLTDSATSAEHRMTQSLTGDLTKTWTSSVYVKAGTGDLGTMLAIYDTSNFNNFVRCVFTNTAGEFTASAPANGGFGSGATASVINIGSGWYRLVLTGIPNTTLSSGTLRTHVNLFAVGASATGIYAGAGNSNIYWQSQLELGAFVTSLIPTTTDAITRAAEYASVDDMSWYNATEGTLRLEIIDRQPSTGVTFALSLGTDSQNYIGLGYNSATSSIGTSYMKNGNVGPNLGDSNTTRTRLVLAWDGAEMAMANDRSAIVSAANGGVPPVVNMRIGRGHYGGSIVSGHYRKITYWNKRFPDGTLGTLSEL